MDYQALSVVVFLLAILTIGALVCGVAGYELAVKANNRAEDTEHEIERLRREMGIYPPQEQKRRYSSVSEPTSVRAKRWVNH